VTRSTCAASSATARIPTCWKRPGAEKADMIIAVTFYDEVNIVACEVAHALFNVPMKIAALRARNPICSRTTRTCSRASTCRST
jgi:trk system potassium uptake protein TrkA